MCKENYTFNQVINFLVIVQNKLKKELQFHVPYLPVYKSTFQDLKISPKIRPRLIHGSKLEIQALVK